MGNAYVTGRCSDDSSYPTVYVYATVKYDSEGNLIWVIHYDEPDSEIHEVAALEVDASGNVYVTGSIKGSTSYSIDIATIKYVQTPTPLAPTLVSPLDGAIIESDTVIFVWQQSGDPVNNFWLEVATNSLMTNPTIDSTISETTKVKYGFINNEIYWWRVKAKNDGGWGPFSETYYFSISTTGIEEAQVFASKFTLSQNFPNPFNSATTIQYTLPRKCFIKLKILNLSGQEISTLIEGERTKGEHTVQWNDNSLASGIYFYQLQASKLIETKKLLLLK
ncbi:T9SS type A sorting domain-containing protein [Bacteroidota bacterium]